MGLTTVEGKVIDANPLSWPTIPGFEGPVCGHAENPFVPKEECRMVIKSTRHRKTTIYFFQAPHEGCKYKSKSQFVI